MFSVVAKKSRTFSSFSYSADEQMCRTQEGAQPGSQPRLVSGSTPYHGYRANFRNRGWLGCRSLSSLISMTLNTLLCGSSNFSGVWSFLGFLWNLLLPGCVIAAWGLAVNHSSKNSIVYSLFCIFIVMIIIISIISSGISISIYFVVLLNCLYLNPWVLLFVHFLSPSHCGGKGRGERATVWCWVASCQVKPWQKAVKLV